MEKKIVLCLFLLIAISIFITSQPQQTPELYCIDSQKLSNGTICSIDTYCSNATCKPLYCTGYEANKHCKTDYIAVDTICQDGKWNEILTYCSDGQICKEGKCQHTEGICGDNICSVGEDCFKDCGSISSWDKYTKAVSESKEALSYLDESKYYDYNSEEIKKIIASIEANPNLKTPYDFFKYSTQYLYSNFHYITGGVSCPESASTSLKRKTGNCVDFSVIQIAILRAKGIPARQVEGCVSHDYWGCKPFALFAEPDLEERILRAGNINDEQPLGHSWIEVWTPDKGWITADPTVGDWISKHCIGYHKISHSKNKEKCYIDNYDEIEFCRGY